MMVYRQRGLYCGRRDKDQKTDRLNIIEDVRCPSAPLCCTCVISLIGFLQLIEAKLKDRTSDIVFDECTASELDELQIVIMEHCKVGKNEMTRAALRFANKVCILPMCCVCVVEAAMI